MHAHTQQRTKLLKLLTEKDICVCEMKLIFPISHSHISRYLKMLYEAGFLKRWNEGKCVVYMADRVDHSGILPPNARSSRQLL
ncbi:ArsR family transcriptional regulator [Chloroflexota bacterium]